MVSSVLTRKTVSITEMKKDPSGIMKGGESVAVLKNNKAAFYAVPAAEFEEMMEQLEDLELLKIAAARADSERVHVSLDDL